MTKLKDPRWQKKRLQILERDGFTCQSCRSTTHTLHVHHRFYVRGREPWDYPEIALVTLCEPCHSNEGEWRSEREAELLAILREKVLAQDVSDISDLFWKMPADVLQSLARIMPPFCGPVEVAHVFDWFKKEREKRDARRGEWDSKHGVAV